MRESGSAGVRAGDERLSVVFITGLSGAGKSYAIKCFEDMGFFCVDNLPTTLIPTFADLAARLEFVDGVEQMGEVLPRPDVDAEGDPADRVT